MDKPKLDEYTKNQILEYWKTKRNDWSVGKVSDENIVEILERKFFRKDQLQERINHLLYKIYDDLNTETYIIIRDKIKENLEEILKE